MLAAVGLEGLERRHPGQLSGGQQQRVALARSLVVEPAILLLDEPLSNLDAKLRERMRTELKTLQRRTGITFIYVTHDQAEAMALSDRIVVFNKGAVQQVGTPREVYERPANLFVADFMGLVNKLPATLIERSERHGARADRRADDRCAAERWPERRRPGAVTVAIRPGGDPPRRRRPRRRATSSTGGSSRARSSATSSTTRSTSAARCVRVQGDRRQTCAPGTLGRASTIARQRDCVAMRKRYPRATREAAAGKGRTGSP